MKRMRRVNRETVLQQMMELAAGAANDAVKLAYLTGEDREQISELDLGALTEFKRSSNGTVEVKLADRAAVLDGGRLVYCGTPEAVYKSGVLDRTFGVNVHSIQTPHGTQYYCTEKEEG